MRCCGPTSHDSLTVSVNVIWTTITAGTFTQQQACKAVPLLSRSYSSVNATKRVQSGERMQSEMREVWETRSSYLSEASLPQHSVLPERVLCHRLPREQGRGQCGKALKQCETDPSRAVQMIWYVSRAQPLMLQLHPPLEPLPLQKPVEVHAVKVIRKGSHAEISMDQSARQRNR